MENTKQLTCIICGEVFTGSKFSSPKTAKCPKCKKVGKKVGQPVIHDGVLNEMVKQSKEGKLSIDTFNGMGRPIKIELIRNRQDIEGNIVTEDGEIVERIPAQWAQVTGKLDYLSVSKMTSYNTCPFKFNKQSLVADPSIDTGNKFSWFGTILHEVMEVAEKIYTENGFIADPLTLYDEAWRKQPLSDMATYHEGRELIKDYFHRHPIDRKPYKTIATELEWRGKLSELVGIVPKELENMDFGAQLDYVGEIDAETAILKDYKSNRIPFTPDQLDESVQLRVYEIIARKLFPQYKKWITGYEMFRFGWQQCPERSEEDLEETKAFMINTAMQIVHHGEWRGKLNNLCPYCDFRGECNEYCELLNAPNDIIKSINTDKTDMAQVEHDRQLMASIEKIAKMRKEELANIVKAEIEHAVLNGEQLVIDGKEMYLQAQSRPTYDYYSAKQVALVHGASDILDKCVTINKTKLDKELKNNPQLALEMAKCMQQGYSAPYLMSRKAKKK